MSGREKTLEVALLEAELFIDDNHPEWSERKGVDEVLRIIRAARAGSAKAQMLLLPDPMKRYAICIGGRWHGWLFHRHPDGQWVSKFKLPVEEPAPGGQP